jgi:hypothetical protein
MIGAVAKLQQTVRRHGMVAKRGCAIEPDALTRKFVDFAGGLPKIVFQSHPIGLMEAAEHNAKAVIGELDGPEVLLEQGRQGLLVTQRPVLDGDLAMVGLGEDEGNPGGRQRAVAESLMVVVRAEMALQDVRQSELLDDAQEQGDVVHAFVL